MTTEIIQTMYGCFEGWKDDLITSQLRDFSAHTRNELAMLRQFVRPGDCLLDIGAHIGTFAVPFARFVGDTGRVIAFEANPDNFSLLRKNIDRNGLAERIETHRGVVTSRREPCAMHLEQGANSGMYFFPPARQGEACHAVIHLDEWLDGRADILRADLIKIDVEGAEMDVLHSCSRHMVAHRPALYVEINAKALRSFGASPSEIERHLRTHGYRLFRNIGDRNSSHDRFHVVECGALEKAGEFFDVLGVHESDERCRKAERLEQIRGEWSDRGGS